MRSYCGCTRTSFATAAKILPPPNVAFEVEKTRIKKRKLMAFSSKHSVWCVGRALEETADGLQRDAVTWPKT